ncbi:hypothetical protein DUNSADRAFT_17350 [Dunaliella salina]|uniref:Uncharacterized protein n=1 Tax=Dunaliella salina TaxID=3046 RepID=A0ABQ7H058_DUNSA|nr:hypothetical protein DUNSADRAFT_17350 [Dunaliella salina]|eukprot:KAF5840247.1 hypothetical protein DUNSADRAFT_17350 [Dunaliella salina]
MLEDSGNAWQASAQAASEGEAGPQQQQQPSSSSQGPGTPSPSDASNGKSKAPEQNGRRDLNLTDEEARQLLDAEEEKRKQRRRQKKGRIRELEEARALIAENQLILLGKEAELLQKEQTLDVLKEQLDLERKLRALLTKEKEKAEEEAALAMGLCTGSAMLP